MKRTRPIRLLITAVAVVAAGSACSSRATAPSQATGTSQAAASRAPLLIGSEAPLSSPIASYPGFQASAEAAVSAINAAGGVDGHPLKFDFCDTKLEAAQELACARNLISEHVVAVVDPIIFADQSGAELKLFDQAGIPYFGGQGVSPAEMEDPNSYPLSSGAVGWYYGAVKALERAGATKVAIYADSNPAAQFVAGLARDALSAFKVTNAGSFTADLQADPTLAASAAKVVASGADGVVMAPSNFPLMVTALRQAGYKGKLATISSTTRPASLKALGSLADGILVSSLTALPSDTANPAVVTFRANMGRYAPNASLDTNDLTIYAAVQLFAKVMDTATGTALNSGAFKTALANLGQPADIGLVGPSAIKGRTPALPAYP